MCRASVSPKPGGFGGERLREKTTLGFDPLSYPIRWSHASSSHQTNKPNRVPSCPGIESERSSCLSSICPRLCALRASKSTGVMQVFGSVSAAVLTLRGADAACRRVLCRGTIVLRPCESTQAEAGKCSTEPRGGGARNGLAAHATRLILAYNNAIAAFSVRRG